MTGDRNKIVSLKENKDGTVSFGNDGSSNVIGLGTVTLERKHALAKNILLVENMNHNLLNSTKCEIRKDMYCEIVATAS